VPPLAVKNGKRSLRRLIFRHSFDFPNHRIGHGVQLSTMADSPKRLPNSGG
jgi:hypothetical protein